MIDITKIPALSMGKHPNMQAGACIMEAVSYVAGEPWSDHPECACPVIGTFLRTWNDDLPDSERDTLLRPLILRLVGTKGSPDLERRRATMAADWLVRAHTPAWLNLAGLTAQADVLSSLPEIVDFSQCPGLMPALKAARIDANAAGAAAKNAAKNAARAAAKDAAWDATWDAVRAATWAAAGDAAWAAVRAAAGDAAWAAVRAVTWAATWAAAKDATWAAAKDAAEDALKPTRIALQQSALALVGRMINVVDA